MPGHKQRDSIHWIPWYYAKTTISVKLHPAFHAFRWSRGLARIAVGKAADAGRRRPINQQIKVS